MPKLSAIFYCLVIVSMSSCVAAGVSSPAKPVTMPGGINQARVDGLASGSRSLTLTIYAAASLTDVFIDLSGEFEILHPGVTVIFGFSGSQVLRAQLEQGAEADVVAFADQQNMELLLSDKLVIPDSSRVFATNKLVVILPQANPGGIWSLADLAQPGKRVLLVDDSVPAGRYARQILSKLNQDPLFGSDFSTLVMANIVSNEIDVRQVVTKVELGEADAGIVYMSDVLSASGLITIPIPDRYNVTAQYTIAVLSDAPNPDLAKEFIAYVTSPAGQKLLEKWGFSPVK